MRASPSIEHGCSSTRRGFRCARTTSDVGTRSHRRVHSSRNSDAGLRGPSTDRGVSSSRTLPLTRSSRTMCRDTAQEFALINVAGRPSIERGAGVASYANEGSRLGWSHAARAVESCEPIPMSSRTKTCCCERSRGYTPRRLSSRGALSFRRPLRAIRDGAGSTISGWLRSLFENDRRTGCVSPATRRSGRASTRRPSPASRNEPLRAHCRMANRA